MKVQSKLNSKFKLGPWQEAWVKTLESGDFDQSTEKLCYKDISGNYSFCCLGVFCEVAIENRIKVKCNENDFGALYEGHAGTLPNKLNELLKLHSLDGAIDHNYLPPNTVLKSYKSLTVLNDSGKFSFEKIAYYIRKYPRAFFEGSN